MLANICIYFPLNCPCFEICYISITEEAAVDEKKGKLYKPKSRILEAKSFLPLDTPPQFLAIDKRNVSFLSFIVIWPDLKKKIYFVLLPILFLLYYLDIEEGR